MKQITWAIGLAVLLFAGSALPAEAAGGGGFHGGGTGGFHTGGSMSDGGFHGGSGARHGGAPGRHGGFHRGTRVFIAGSFGWWGPPYLDYVDPSVVVEQGPTPPSDPQYWYYCQNAGAYYPYIKDCPGGWITVVPSPNPPTP